jgi:hypothetical protein
MLMQYMQTIAHGISIKYKYLNEKEKYKMDFINVPAESFYFLFGNYLVEEKKRQGFVILDGVNETFFKTSVGFFVYYWINNN